MVIKVKLRQRPISKGRKSLYLDFYPPINIPNSDKKTRREFLNLFIYEPIRHKVKNLKNGQKKTIPIYDEDPEQNFIKEKHNSETILLAEQIKEKKQYVVNKSEVYTEFEKEQIRLKELGERNFVEYFKIKANEKGSGWLSAYEYLTQFTNGVVKFADLNEVFFNDFKNYLLKTKSNKSLKANLSQNSAVSYFNKIKAALRMAYKEGVITIDINARIDPIRTAETQRNFLTIEELNKLLNTDCNNPLLKRAALFSALTGLRFSDLLKLKWEDLEYINGEGYILKFIQQKTKGVEILPISDQAAGLLGEPLGAKEKIFDGLTYSAYENKHLYQWIGAAGITKNITFHCFRHTYATLLLSNGTDLYTVSKMLGHRSIKTTQIYAKVVDKMKRDAADRIKLNL